MSERDFNRDDTSEGVHRGALAGLSEEARAAAVDAYIQDAHAVGWSPAAYLEGICIDAPPCTSLRECLELTDRDFVNMLAYMCEIENVEGLEDDELIDLVVEYMDGDERVIDMMLLFANSQTLKAIEQICRTGSSMKVDAESLTSLRGVPRPLEPVLYGFFHEGEFVFIVPDEVRFVLEDRNWDATIRAQDERQRVISFAESALDIWGAASIESLFGEYCRHYPDVLGFEGFCIALEQPVVPSGEEMFARFVPPGEDIEYLVHTEIEDEVHVLERDWRRGRPASGMAGTTLLEHILLRQDEIGLRPIDDCILEERSAFDWMCNLPASIALINYLDAHVPDGKDDYLFADKAIEDLVVASWVGAIPNDAFKYLESLGLTLDAKGAKHLSGLITNMYSMLPRWENGGWSTVELEQRSTGKKVFFNEEGGVMNVGRNDPCPCGSGKKYKKCCGRAS